MDKKLYIFLAASAVIILGAGTTLWYYSQTQTQTTPAPPHNDINGRDHDQKQDDDKDVSIRSKYENKIVYESNQEADMERLKQDCRERDGQFNECGSVCGPEAETCASVCAYTCNISKDKDHGDRFGKWQTHTDEKHGFSMDYPSALKVEETAAEAVKFTLLGPTQRQGTEIFDGISVTVRTATHSQESLKDYVDSRVQKIERVGDVIQEPEKVVLNGNNGYRYEKVTAGRSTVLIFPFSQGEVINISYAAPDPQNRGYKEVVKEMVSSFEILDSSNKASINLYYIGDQSLKESCSATAAKPVARTIQDSDTLIKDTIKLLIRGDLTTEERQQGFSTEFSEAENLQLEKAGLQDGTLTLEFSDPDNFASGGSCRVQLLEAQVRKTALQFFEVQKVRVQPEKIFQP